jgi:hypothetical protein
MDGGGVYCLSSPSIVNCLISGNTANRGGGVYCGYNASPRFRRTAIVDNAVVAEVPIIPGRRPTGGRGGGVYCLEAAPLFEDCTVAGNRSAVVPGAVWCSRGTLAHFQGCSIAGGVWCDGSSPRFTASDLTGSPGAGLIAWSGSSPVLEDCVVSENAGAGLDSSQDSTVTLVHSTVAGNLGAGVGLSAGSSASLKSCIVWENVGGSITFMPGGPKSTVTAASSCIQGDAPWPGEGNILLDPLFCGWGAAPEVHVDASSTDGGDGSAARPYSNLEQALDYSLALSRRSPCRGSGEGGGDMGASRGACEDPGTPTRLVRIRPGTYSLDGLSLAHGAGLEGAGEGETILEGTVRGLRTGASLSRLTVRGGITVLGQGESPRIVDCTVENSGWSGISIAGGASPALLRVTVRRNLRRGIVVNDASPTLVACTIAENRGSGVVCVNSAARLDVCTIAGNDADEDRSGGGMLCFNSTVLLAGSTITGNLAESAGGLGVVAGSSLTLINCVVAANAARSTIGGLWSYESSLELVNSTVTGNIGGDGVGNHVGPGSTASLTNCIVWGNGFVSLAGSEVAFRVRSSCVESGSVWPGEGNILADPFFASPGNFDLSRFKTVEIAGVEVEVPDFLVEPPDYRLAPSSPAINRGTLEAAPETDIAGNARPCWGAADMGAHEYCGAQEPIFTPPFLRGDVNADGHWNLTDPFRILDFLFLGGPAPACLKSADTDDSGALNITDPVHLLNYLFLGGPAPAEPFGACGADRTLDRLPCESFGACA